MTYKVLFHEFDTKEPMLICEDRSLTVTTIPLRHRMPCCGFLFAEKRRPNHIIREMVDFYQVPVYELNRIKNGADYVTPEGKTVSNNLLTRPSAPSRSYAYCSDTIYLPSIVEQIKGVDLLFHEATFANEDAPRAKETFHTTAAQAAEIARRAEVKKLLIGHFRHDTKMKMSCFKKHPLFFRILSLPKKHFVYRYELNFSYLWQSKTTNANRNL